MIPNTYVFKKNHLDNYQFFTQVNEIRALSVRGYRMYPQIFSSTEDLRYEIIELSDEFFLEYTSWNVLNLHLMNFILEYLDTRDSARKLNIIPYGNTWN